MLISVVMPVYNGEEYLKNTIDSILNQSYEDWELVCVDDGSSDGSWDIINSYACRNPRIRGIHIKNQGVSTARNIGLKETVGDIISFIDSDDYIAPNLYENVMRAYTETNFDVCIVGLERRAECCAPDTIEYTQPKKILYSTVVDKMNDNRSDIIGGVVNKFYKKDLMQEKFFDDDIYIVEDMLFNCRVLKQAECIVYMPGKYYKYNVSNADSASKNVFHSLKGFEKLKSGVESYSRMMSICGNLRSLKASQGIMYMNLLLIMQDLKIDEEKDKILYRRLIKISLKDVLLFRGIDFKHKMTYLVTCISPHLGSKAKELGVKISGYNVNNHH